MLRTWVIVTLEAPANQFSVPDVRVTVDDGDGPTTVRAAGIQRDGRCCAAMEYDLRDDLSPAAAARAGGVAPGVGNGWG